MFGFRSESQLRGALPGSCSTLSALSGKARDSWTSQEKTTLISHCTDSKKDILAFRGKQTRDQARHLVLDWIQ
ncbi:hypothetical protein EBR96_09445, partial [bacterium]|nr:hypothetical protein [bacterium]